MPNLSFFTGFEGTGQTADVLPFFDTQYNMSYNASNGYDGSKCALGGASSYFTRGIVATKTIATGFHIKGAATHDYLAIDQYCLLKITVGSSYCRVFNTDTGLEVYLDSTLIASSGSGKVDISSSLNHFEMKLFSDASAGTVNINVNGISLIAATSLNTGGSDITEILYSSSSSNAKYYDNVYIADGLMGEMYSVVLLPESDSSVQFTPDSGLSNYARIDEPAQDGDSSYVESSTVGQEDLYNYDPIATSGLTILGVSIVTIAKKDDAGTRTLTVVANQSSTDYDQNEWGLALNYPSVAGEGLIDILPTAPDSSAWTPTILNAMTFGFKVAS